MLIFRNFSLCTTFIFLALFSVSNHATEDAKNFDIVISNLIKSGDELSVNYSAKNSLKTGDGYSRLYFDQFESSGLEFRLTLVNSELTARIELGFSVLIQSAIAQDDQQVINDQWQALKGYLQTIDTSQLNSESWVSSFTQSLLILLREGVEAILIIALLVTLLTRSGHGDKLYLIGAGVGAALVTSVGLVFLFQYLIANSGQLREAIEGFVLLAAALLLCYVGFWLLSQKESHNWQQFLHEKIQQDLEKSNQIAVFFMAYLAVLREGAETILFYQALIIESQSFDDALYLGVLAALVLLVIFYLFLHKIIQWIRLDYFFKATAVFLLVIAVTFVGKGIMELQAVAYIPATQLASMPMIQELGLFPTLQGYSAQAIVALLLLVILRKSIMPKTVTNS